MFLLAPGAVVLAEFLAESRFLQTLDVRQNLVLTGGLMAFALALKLNHTLLHLDLDQNPKEEKVRECHVTGKWETMESGNYGEIGNWETMEKLRFGKW